MRSREQIVKDVEYRLKQLSDEAERRKNLPPKCKHCRWYSKTGNCGTRWGSSFPQWHTCVNPIIKGFNKYGKEVRYDPMPCGPEKALWEPKFWPRFWKRLTGR